MLNLLAINYTFGYIVTVQTKSCVYSLRIIRSNKKDKSQRNCSVFRRSNRWIVARLRHWLRFLEGFRTRFHGAKRARGEPIKRPSSRWFRKSARESRNRETFVFVLPIAFDKTTADFAGIHTWLCRDFKQPCARIGSPPRLSLNSERATEWKARRTAPPAEISLPTDSVINYAAAIINYTGHWLGNFTDFYVLL